MTHPLRILGRALCEPVLLRGYEADLVKRMGERLFEGGASEEEVKAKGWTLLHRGGKPASVRRAMVGGASGGIGAMSQKVASALADPEVRFGGVVMLDNGVAMLSIAGVLDKSDGDVLDSGGDPFGTSYERVAQQCGVLAENSMVRTVLVRVDSPGGSSAGVDIAASALRALAAVKPVWAIADDIAASGGYWLASQAGPGRLFATTTAWLGSIGALAVFSERSKAIEARGEKVTPIKSIETKDVGAPYRPMTEADRAVLQAQINRLGETFTQAVMVGRGVDRQTVATWQAAEGDFGQGAVDKGLADGLVSSLGAMADALASGKEPGSADTKPTKEATMSMTREELSLKHPELLKQIEAQAHKAGADAAIAAQPKPAEASAAKPAKATISELRAAFKDEPAFVCDCAEKELTMVEAKAAYADVQTTRLTAMTKERDELAKKAGEKDTVAKQLSAAKVQPGTEPVGHVENAGAAGGAGGGAKHPYLARVDAVMAEKKLTGPEGRKKATLEVLNDKEGRKLYENYRRASTVAKNVDEKNEDAAD